ncbi:hypothetical protein DICPUDRAFT_79591 [Dictyostelium purpureum]|uniref:Uncharacterized protein n=1 Tax=Dictyostelium purpureum TaxID=5786 RepID=F0ZN24_DICPU|nr:uncharacterized protein DICPUDRAFT_79591 [Dictyostelium purpureum]EGC34667.1 hypothetical protein DICPUDRAFT_79591 [Dictyostelium purpureum]|eukprot:XP_003288804.1 hypothetical protein DICPUDRAFT_79591 [Dictyostelium purpureum]
MDNQKTLNNNINSLCQISHFQNTIKTIKNLSVGNDDIDWVLECKKRKEEIKTPDKLISLGKLNLLNLSQKEKITVDNSIFSKINKHIEETSRLIGIIPEENNEIIESLKNLIIEYSNYREKIINKFNLYKSSDNNKIFNDEELDLFFRPVVKILKEDLLCREILLTDGYKIASYCRKKNEFVKKNKYGLSYGSSVQGVYYKVDTDDHFLCPVRENAVYTFFKIFFNSENYISPTQMIFLNIPITEKESKARKNEEELEIQNDFIREAVQMGMMNFPELMRKMNFPCKIKTVSIQASHLISGIPFNEFLEQHKDNSSNLSSLIDLKSFSAHFISSLLLSPDDGRGDNFFLQDNKTLVGIDSDGSISYDEIQKTESNYFVKSKNILYTLPLMDEVIDNSIIDIFKKMDIELFILEWLGKSNQKEILIGKMLDEILENCDSAIKSYKRNLSLPTVIPDGWITKFLNRFIKIKEELDSFASPITHKKLFKKISPFLSLYYKSLANRAKKTPIEERKKDFTSDYNYQIFIMGEHMSFKEMCDNYSGLEKKDLLKVYEKLKETEFFPHIDNNLDLTKEYKKHQYSTIEELITFQLKALVYCVESFNDDRLSKIVQIINNLIKNESNLTIKLSSDNFHSTWEQNKYSILLRLIKNGESYITIENIIQILEIDLNTEQSKLESTFHSVICSSHSNETKLKQLEVLKKYGADIEVLNDYHCTSITPLDYAVIEKNNQLFVWFIKNGSGSKSMRLKNCVSFYCTLLNSEKKELEPYMNSLYHINQRLAWKFSIHFLLPCKKESNTEKETKINKKSKIEIETFNKTRVLKEKYINQIFEKDNNNLIPKKNNLGKSPVPFIEDFGLRIYFKFWPVFPGNEKSVSILSDLLFGTCTPFSKVVLVDGKFPVLLTQYVPGEELIYKFFKESSPIRNKIHSDESILKLINKEDLIEKPIELDQIQESNLSRQLILAMIINNADGNFGNFIISKVLPNQYRIVSIDNELTYTPPIIINSKSNKSIGSSNALLVLDLMLKKVDISFIEELKSINIEGEIEKWLIKLKTKHSLSNALFNKIKDQINQTTIIGTPMHKNSIYTIYSKLLRLKKDLTNEMTYFDIYFLLEPELAIRLEPILFNPSLSPIKRYFTFKNLQLDSKISEISGITNPINLSLETSNIPNYMDIIENIKQGKFLPKQAFEEFQSIKEQVNQLNDVKSNKPLIKFFDSAAIERVLYDLNFQTMTKQEEINFFNIIKKGKLNVYSVHIKNSKIFSSDHFYRLFIPTSITRIYITNSPTFEGFLGKEFLSLTHLNVEGCSNLTKIKVNAKNLKYLNASGCPLLTEIITGTPHLECLLLKDTITNNNHHLLDIVSKYKDLKILDIGFSKETQIESLELYFILPKLLQFLANNLIGIKKIIIYMPQVNKFEANLSTANFIFDGLAYYNNKEYSLLAESSKRPISINIFGLINPFSKYFLNHLESKVKSLNIGCILSFNFQTSFSVCLVKKETDFYFQTLFCNSFIFVILELDGNESQNIINEKLKEFYKGNNKIFFNHIKFILITIGEKKRNQSKINDLKKFLDFSYEVNIPIAKAPKNVSVTWEQLTRKSESTSNNYIKPDLIYSWTKDFAKLNI